MENQPAINSESNIIDKIVLTKRNSSVFRVNIVVFGVFFIGVNTAVIALDRLGKAAGGYGFGYWTAILMFLIAIIIKFAESYRKDEDVFKRYITVAKVITLLTLAALVAVIAICVLQLIDSYTSGKHSATLRIIFGLSIFIAIPSSYVCFKFFTSRIETSQDSRTSDQQPVSVSHVNPSFQLNEIITVSSPPAYGTEEMLSSPPISIISPPSYEKVLEMKEREK